MTDTKGTARVWPDGEIIVGDALIARVYAAAGLGTAEGAANARRIVAAVNACEGISTGALEQGVVADLLAACEEIVSTEIGADTIRALWPWLERVEATIAKAKEDTT